MTWARSIWVQFGEASKKWQKVSGKAYIGTGQGIHDPRHRQNPGIAILSYKLVAGMD